MTSGSTKTAVLGIVLALAAGFMLVMVYRSIVDEPPASIVEVQPLSPTTIGPADAAGLPGPSGVVRSADGKPVQQAEVLLATPRNPIALYTPRPGDLAARTDAQGKFAFPPVQEWDALIVRSDAGFAQLSPKALAEANGQIVLQPWGRIEGIALAGKQPLANQTISMDIQRRMNMLIDLPDQPGRRRFPSVSHVQSTRTDAQGRFTFARAAPGEFWIRRDVTSSSRSMRPTHSAFIILEPGRTIQVQLGGKGRPVIGTIGTAGVEEPLRFEGGIVHVQPLQPLGTPDNWDQLSEAAKQRFQDQRKSPEYAAIGSPRGLFTVTVAPSGTFRADDIPAGEYDLSLVALAPDLNPGRSGVMEPVAVAQTRFTLPEMPEGRSDEPLDLGRIEATYYRRLKEGQTAPDLQARTLDGKTWRLADCRGKFVLLHALFPGMSVNGGNAMWDRFGGDQRLVMVGVYVLLWPDQTRQSLSEQNVPWLQVLGGKAQGTKIPAEYFGATQQVMYVIDPDGKILVRSNGPAAAYGALDAALPQPTAGQGDVRVRVEHNPNETSTPAFTFPTLPSIAKDDAGQQAVFKIIDGRKAGFGGDIATLNDGTGPLTHDDESRQVTFDLFTLEGRLLADLRRTLAVDQINTYTWYKNGNRYPQVYRVYGSDGASPDFNPEPKSGTNPATCGWKLIATIDTRPNPGGIDLRDGVGGQDAVSIASPNGPIGPYRYLLFEIFATETRDRWGQTFWSEIDIIERPAGK